jgi:hypothetical protein
VNPVLDDILVAVALLASAAYALLSLGPRALRRRALARVAGWALRAPARFGVRGLAARLGAASAKTSGACGGCDNCGSEGAAAETSASARGADVKIPLTSIGRRR